MSIATTLRALHRSRSAVCSALALALTVGSVSASFADYRDQAKRIHDRLAGVPPTEAVLNVMTDMVDPSKPGTAIDAAMEAMKNPAFYDVTLKNFVTPWTNEEQTAFAPLNDYTATVIGMIRDDVPFNQVLSADILYIGDRSKYPALPAYSMTNNDLYEAMENQGVPLKDALMRTTQSAMTDLPAGATAGIMTTRAAAEAFFIAGTNRAMFRFTMINHLCKDLEHVKDTTRPPDRIRQDVSRSPGGDSRIFLNACIGCHSGMDPLAQAYAYYDYDETAGRIVYNDVGTVDPDTGDRVQGKYRINSDNFKYGYVTPDDHWSNYWRSGPNSLLGWDTNGLGLPDNGMGVKSMGTELENSEAFARCQVQKVFKAVCLRAPGDDADRAQVDLMTTSFKSHNYSMKQVFAEAADYCKGD
jgi:hypothetical protein